MALADLFKKKSSGNVAKDRLKFVLVSDRANCSPDTMKLLRDDIIKVISKYMEIDPEDGLIFVSADVLLRRMRFLQTSLFTIERNIRVDRLVVGRAFDNVIFDSVVRLEGNAAISEDMVVITPIRDHFFCGEPCVV